MLFCARVESRDAQPLRDLLGRRRSAIELDRAALEIARLEYPDLSSDSFIAELDRYAAEIADRAHDLSDGPRFIRAANEYLFEELGFQGNDEDYYNADNSFLNRVIESKRGIPITLSVIWLEVSRRLAKPVVGIGLPGHFLIYYDDGQFSTYIDPYHQGALLDADGCRRLVGAESLDAELLAPVDKRSILMRMINNLRQIYFSGHDSARSLRLLDLLIAADPSAADEHKQRGVALLQMRQMSASLSAFRTYLELAPEASDREQIAEQVRSLAQWLASRN